MIEVPNSRVAEKRLHGHFYSKRLRGEWFALDDSDIELIKGFPQSFDRLPPNDSDEDDIPF